MGENNGIIEAARVLGDEIIRLNNELSLAGYRIETLQATNAKLEAENEQLARKLDSVKEYAANYAG